MDQKHLCTTWHKDTDASHGQATPQSHSAETPADHMGGGDPGEAFWRAVSAGEGKGVLPLRS